MVDSKKRLLIVDDEVAMRRMIRELFEDCCEVLEASNGLEAIEQALVKRPDCILLDIMMPEMGGYVVCEILKQIKRTQLIPVIIVSGKGDQVDEKLALETGAFEFVTKPFNLKVLRQRILDTLNNKPKERRLNARLVITLPVRIESTSQDPSFCIHTTTEDVSSHGLRFCGELDVKVGDLIHVSTLSGSRDRKVTYAGKARIVWLDDRYLPLVRCGGQFIETAPEWILKS